MEPAVVPERIVERRDSVCVADIRLRDRSRPVNMPHEHRGTAQADGLVEVSERGGERGGVVELDKGGVKGAARNHAHEHVPVRRTAGKHGGGPHTPEDPLTPASGDEKPEAVQRMRDLLAAKTKRDDADASVADAVTDGRRRLGERAHESAGRTRRKRLDHLSRVNAKRAVGSGAINRQTSLVRTKPGDAMAEPDALAKGVRERGGERPHATNEAGQPPGL